jgi:hypothetical protein
MRGSSPATAGSRAGTSTTTSGAPRHEHPRGDHRRRAGPRAGHQGAEARRERLRRPAATPGAGPSAKPPPRFTDLVISAAELDALEIDPVGFVVEDLLPVGLAVLSAPPKVGKTWFDMALAEAVANGEPFAGCLPTDRGDVLLLDLEGNRRRAQSRLRRLRRGASAATSLEIANEWPRMDLGGLEMIRQWAEARRRPRLVVIDIWARFRPPRPKNADAYQHDYDCVRRLQELAHELGVAIVVVHHNRKAADADWLNEISGSQGIAGGADTILIIRRDRAAADAVLHVSGRDVEERELALGFDEETCRWSIVGDAAEHRMGETRRRILALLDRMGPMTPKDVAEELGMKRTAVKVVLGRMRNDGVLKSAGGGRYAIP